MKKLFYTFILVLCAQLMAAASGDSYHFQRAEEAYNKEDYETCLHYCKEGVKKNAKDGKCWAVIAEIYSKRQFARYGEALQASEKALAVLPKKDTKWRAFVHGIRGDVFYKIENYASSKEEYMTASAMQPDNTTFLYDIADVCCAMEEYATAVTYYKRFLDISPATVYVYGDLALASYLAGDKTEAQRYCDLTNALSSGGNCMAHRVLAKLAFDKGDYVMACREIARATFCAQRWYEEADSISDRCPDLFMAAVRTEMDDARTSVDAIAVAGHCAYALHRYMDAVYYLHRKLELSDAPQTVYSELGYVYDDVDELGKSKEYYLMALKTDSSAAIWSNIGRAERRMGNYDRAIPYFRRALQEQPSNGHFYYFIAQCQIELGDLSAALHTLDTAQLLLEEEDWLLSTAYYRAEIYRQQGDEEKVQQTLAQAQRMRQPDDKRPEFYILDALAGDTARAVRRLEELKDDRKAAAKEALALAHAFALFRDKERTAQAFRTYYEAGEYAMRLPLVSSRYAFLRDDPDFRAMLARYDSLRLQQLAEVQKRLGTRDTLMNRVTELPFTSQGGVNRVQCSINGLPLYFVFDTGASDVSISSVEANFMLKNGYLTNADFMGKQNYVTATGEIHEGTVINLREVRVGDVVLRDIKASVVRNQSAPLLLGQTCFRRFGKVEVDNQAQLIRLIAQ